MRAYHNDWTAGHETDPFGWRGSQRDPLFNYNGEESSCLWAGVPGDTISCADIIVEDDGAGWSQYGAWTQSTAGNGFRMHWTNVWIPADYWAKWTPSVPYQGYYKVYAFIPAVNATTTNARYEVHHQSGTTIVPINQYNVSDAWASLGTFALQPSASYVQLYDYTGEASGSKQIAADAVKFSASIVYLPYVVNSGGWTSSIVIRNNSSTSAQATINYYNASGGLVTYQTAAIGSNGTVIQSPPSSFAGSAAVVASEDVSVVVELQSGNTADSYNGIAASDPRNPGWGQVGTTLYAPVIMNNYYDWYTELVLVNTGSALATVNVEYYSGTGVKVRTDTFQVSANGQIVTNYYSAAGLYSARIVSNQPLAAIIRERNGNGAIYYNYDGLSAGATTAYAPLIMNNYYGWDTSVNVQNTSANWANISIEYRLGDGSLARSPHADTLAPYSAHTYWSPNEGLPAGFIGSVRVISSQPVAVVVNQSSPHGGTQTRGMSYAGSLNGSTFVVLPDVLNHYGSEDWVSSVNIQNLSASATNVTLTYAGQSRTRSINPNGYVIFYVPNDWGTGSIRGPATVSAGQPVAVVVNHASATYTGVDLARNYNGIGR